MIAVSFFKVQEQGVSVVASKRVPLHVSTPCTGGGTGQSQNMGAVPESPFMICEKVSPPPGDVTVID